jgi:hypothetical protein
MIDMMPPATKQLKLAASVFLDADDQVKETWAQITQCFACDGMTLLSECNYDKFTDVDNINTIRSVGQFATLRVCFLQSQLDLSPNCATLHRSWLFNLIWSVRFRSRYELLTHVNVNNITH